MVMHHFLAFRFERSRGIAPAGSSSLLRDKKFDLVQFFLLGWTEQKNVYSRFSQAEGL
jgi:hypothetical protein